MAGRGSRLGELLKKKEKESDQPAPPQPPPQPSPPPRLPATEQAIQQHENVPSSPSLPRKVQLKDKYFELTFEFAI